MGHPVSHFRFPAEIDTTRNIYITPPLSKHTASPSFATHSLHIPPQLGAAFVANLQPYALQEAYQPVSICTSLSIPGKSPVIKSRQLKILLFFARFLTYKRKVYSLNSGAACARSDTLQVPPNLQI
jgi:hypothetical protein